jgi:hemerythrin-like domain-containing protein
MKRCHPGSIRDAAARSVERPDPGRPERQNRKESEVDPIELLMTEHRLIERALDAMDAWITTLSPESEADDKEELARFVSFIRGFADAYHHGKEEDILFVALDGLAKQPATWSEQDRETLARTVREFSALLRQHIQKEDQILYPMADTRLPEPVKEEMSRRFQAFEEQQSSSGEHQRLHTLADALIKAHTP